MTHVPHELAEEFPKLADKIHLLKGSDAHFARLVDDYHEVNRAVHRAESRIDNVDSTTETTLRAKRLHLKDEIARVLSRS